MKHSQDIYNIFKNVLCRINRLFCEPFRARHICPLNASKGFENAPHFLHPFFLFGKQICSRRMDKLNEYGPWARAHSGDDHHAPQNLYSFLHTGVIFDAATGNRRQLFFAPRFIHARMRCFSHFDKSLLSTWGILIFLLERPSIKTIRLLV